MLNNIRNLLSSVPYKKTKLNFRSYVVAALIAVMLLSTSSVFAVPVQGLVAVGPTTTATGYPSWYKDSNGIRTELCLDDGPICGFLPGDIPNPGDPISVPDNYPTTGEAFYMLGNAIMETDSATGGKAILVVALEAAFSGGSAIPGDQITFGRVRIWIDNLIPSAQYRVTHPYGVDNFTADPVFGRRMIRYVEDIGIGSPGDFTGALNSRIGPFLVWDPAVLPAAPVGYIGDPDVLHPVTGSPLNTNFFRVEGPAGSFPGSADQCADPILGDDPIATDDCIQMNQFSMIGKYAINADVNANRATYTQSNAVGGQIDVFANTEPGMDIQVNGFGSPILIPDGNGYYFTQVNFSGNPPAQLQITNTSDTPDSTKMISVVDLVTITKAEFNTDTGTLSVEAISSDTFNDPVLTTVGLGILDAGGKLEVPSLAIPPQHVTVTSARGGSATVSVVVRAIPPLPPLPIPTITSFTPASGLVGTSVTITGTNFSGATDVSFNGTTAAFTVDSGTSISAIVPATATTGTISVDTPDGTATSLDSFIVTMPMPAPAITSFTPTSGPTGTSVTITGTNFSGATNVSFNGTTAAFTVDSDTLISAIVPATATTGTISVSTPNGIGTSIDSFVLIPAPTITSFTPASALTGTSVTITGTNFSGATDVSFNGTTAAFTVDSGTSISTSVPAGATTGKISVTTAGGPVVSAANFTVIPLTTFSMPTSFAFGTRSINTNTTKAVLVTNTGTSPLIISSATAGAPFTVTLGSCSIAVAPGGTCKLNVTFRPTAIIPYTVTLTVVGNTASISQTVTLTGAGK